MLALYDFFKDFAGPLAIVIAAGVAAWVTFTFSSKQTKIAQTQAEIASERLKAGEKPFSTHVLATFPDLKISEIRQLQNQYWNAFKHARTHGGIDREDSELLERFGDEVNDHTLYIGWYDYMLAVRALPIEAQIFQVW